MKKVIELIRVSTEAQAGDDRASIPAQRAVNRRTATQYGLRIIETVELSDVSGTAVLNTPEMQQLILRLQSAELDGVVCREFSRLMRPERFGDYALLAAFQENRKILYLPDGPVNFDTRQGMLLGGIRALMAGHERAEMLERVFSAKEAMRRAGKSPNGSRCLPFAVAYDRDRAAWSYRPELAPKVTEVFRRFLAGEQNYNLLSQTLGVSRGAAKYILTNPIYTGWLVVDKKRDLSREGKRAGKDGRQSDRRKIERGPEDVIRVKVIEQPLISEPDFRRVQSIVASKAHTALHERVKLGEFVYNGFLRCAACGERLHTFRNQFDRFYYICSNKKRKDAKGRMLCRDTHYMNRERLEKLLDDVISRKLGNPRVLKAIAREQVRRSKSGEGKREVERLGNLIEALGAKRARCIDMFADGVIEKSERDARLIAIDRDAEKARTALARKRPEPTFNPAELAALFEPFSNWDLLARPEKRRMLNALSPEFSVADYRLKELRLLGVPLNIFTDSRCPAVGA